RTTTSVGRSVHRKTMAATPLTRAAAPSTSRIGVAAGAQASTHAAELAPRHSPAANRVFGRRIAGRSITTGFGGTMAAGCPIPLFSVCEKGSKVERSTGMRHFRAQAPDAQRSSDRRRKLEADDAGDDQADAHEPRRVRWLAEQNDAQDHRADRAHAHPH